MSFIDSFLQHTQFYESPTSFWRWAGYTIIAATLRDNCYRRLGDSLLYPNIYTLLLAESAVHRKGKPVVLGEALVEKVNNTKLISGRSSIQAILDELARGETDKKTGKLVSGGSALFSAQELAAGIVQDPEAIKIITDIYDFKPNFKSRLRGSGVFQIKNLCFTMLAASNEEFLKDVYDIKALYGGLLGRTFLVRPDEFRRGNSLFSARDTTEGFLALVKDLTEISHIKGEFEVTEDAQKEYEKWYLPFRESYRSKSDKSGISGRIHTSALKLAMIICVDKTRKLVIEENHIEEAISYCMRLMPNYSSLVMSSGKSTTSEIAAVLIEDIWRSKNRVLSKGEFLGRYFHQFDLDLVDKAMTTLVQAGLIKEFLSGSEISYTVTDKCKNVFNLEEKK